MFWIIAHIFAYAVLYAYMLRPDEGRKEGWMDG